MAPIAITKEERPDHTEIHDVKSVLEGKKSQRLDFVGPERNVNGE